MTYPMKPDFAYQLTCATNAIADELPMLHDAIVASVHWQIDNAQGVDGVDGFTFSPIVPPASGNFQINVRPDGSEILGWSVDFDASITDASDPAASATDLSSEMHQAATERSATWTMFEWADAITLMPRTGTVYKVSFHAGMIIIPGDGLPASQEVTGLGIALGDPDNDNSSSTWLPNGLGTWCEVHAGPAPGGWAKWCVQEHSPTLAACTLPGTPSKAVSKYLHAYIHATPGTGSMAIGKIKYLRSIYGGQATTLMKDLDNGVDYVRTGDITICYGLHPIPDGFDPVS